jgi:hypothetical protein
MKGGSRSTYDIGVDDNFQEFSYGTQALDKIKDKTIEKVITNKDNRGNIYFMELKFIDGSSFNLVGKEEGNYRGDVALSFEFEEDLG